MGTVTRTPREQVLYLLLKGLPLSDITERGGRVRELDRAISEEQTALLGRIEEAIEKRRAEAQAALVGIPPTEANSALWNVRHEVALQLRAAIAALDDCIAILDDERASNVR